MRVAGSIRMPGDKSISHRALILSALSNGRSRIRGILDSADVRSTASVLRGLGCAIPGLAAEMRISGGGRRAPRPPSADLDCGNSGTTARLLAGVVAPSPFEARFIGDESLSRRPMLRVARPLTAMGARVELERGDGLPMRVHGGALRPIAWDTGAASAQTKSAILLAALFAGVSVVVTESSLSRDHTERMLAALGVQLVRQNTTITLEPAGELRPLDLDVPGDPSSAAFFVALALLAREGDLTVEHVSLNPTRTGFLRVLHRMRARLDAVLERESCGEPVGSLSVHPSQLIGTTIDASEIPSLIDELPLLACAAARAEGETTISGAVELRVKESDRITTTVQNLRAVGVAAEERPDGMCVVGGRHPLRGRVTTGGDHRIAMAFGVLAALPGNDIAIDDPECVRISYPDFWTDLARMRAT